MPRFSTNGIFWDFSSCEIGLLGLQRLPDELMSFTFGDGITRSDIEGTGQMPIGDGRGRYKCDNVVVKSTLEAYLELLNSPSLPKDGYGNKKFPVVLTLQAEGGPVFEIKWPEASLVKQPFNFQQQDASLGISWELKARYMLINGRCIGSLTR